MGWVKTTGLAAAATYGAWAVLRRAEEREQNRGLLAGKRIVILGDGFGGMGVAQTRATAKSCSSTWTTTSCSPPC